MKPNGVLKAFTAFVGFVHALPASAPAAELKVEDLIKLSEGFPTENSKFKKRAGCHPGIVLRRLLDPRYSSSANDFCSKFIQSTVTDTAKVAETLTTETATTLPTVTVTITDVATLTETDFSTSTSFIPTTAIPIPDLAKRGGPAYYPPWLQLPQLFPPWLVSGACSCFLTTPPPPIRTTETVVTGTVTAFSTLTITPADATVTEPTTTVTTITSIIPVQKIINCGVTPACRRPDSGDLGIGSGYTREQCLAWCLGTNDCLSIQFGIGGAVPGVCVLSGRTVEDTIEPVVSAQSPICAWWAMDDVECTYLD